MASEKHPKGGRIYQRGRKWYAACYVGAVEKVKPGGTKYEALRVLRELQRERDEGRSYVPLDAVLTAYGRNLAALRKRSTVKAFREGERILLKHFGPDFCVYDLTIRRINALLGKRKNRGLAPITANKPAKTLRAALHFAVDEQMLKGMPCRIPTLTETKRKPRILSVRKFQKIRDACTHVGARLAIILAYQIGLRHDEIVHLRVRDIQYNGDADNFTVEVRAHGGWTPKAHAERGVVLPDTAFAAVRSHLANHKFVEDRGAPLIYWGVNKPHKYRDLYEPVRKAFQRAGIYSKEDKSGLHMCRRSFASRLLSEGLDLQAVMTAGGWSTIEAVQRYLATTDERMCRAAEIMEVD